MKKITSEIGSEPIYTNLENQSEKLTLIHSFNWYNYNCGKKDAKEFVVDYMKSINRSKDEILAIRSLNESKINLQIGWIARMLCMGFVPSDKTKEYFVDHYKKLITLSKEDLKLTIVTTVTEKPEPLKVNIQDRIREKASEEIAEIEGIVDDFYLSGCKNLVDMESYFRSRKLSAVVMKSICNKFIKSSKHIEEVLEGNCTQLKEGYSNFSKAELRRYKEFLDSIVMAANSGVINNKPIRKKRKVKEKPAVIIVSKLNYMKEFSELNLISISPEKIIGAIQLWAYNTKTKLLSVYNADNAKGLTVKGSTLQNFNEQTSIGKRLRKPEVVLKTLLDAGKVKLKSVMPDLTTKESFLTGRLNSDTIILRIMN